MPRKRLCERVETADEGVTAFAAEIEQLEYLPVTNREWASPRARGQ